MARVFGRVVLSFLLVIGLNPAFAFAAVDTSGDIAFSDGGSTEAPTSDEGVAQAVAGEVLVVYDRTSETSAESQQALSAAGATSAEEVAELDEGDQAVVKVQVDEEKVDDLVAELNASPDVAWAQRNFEYDLTDEAVVQDANAESLDATDDPQLASQYYVGTWSENYGADVENAWSLVQTNQTVTVAVLDTGVLATHEDLQANLDTSHMIDLTSTNPTAGVISDVVGHGTHVAGIVAAQANNAVGVAGVSYNAKVLPIQIFYRSGTQYKTNTAYMIKAYEYLDDLVESGELTDLHVINMSFGGYSEITQTDRALESAIAEMRDDHNVLSVAAGGNGTSTKQPRTDFIMPGDFDECLSVTCLNQDGTDTRWSDYNEYKDISAPGINILSTGNGTTSSYVAKDGTSMATPLVAGVAALLWAADPDLTVDEAVTALESTANSVVQGSTYRGDATGSAGCVDAAAAVQYVLDNYVVPASRDDLATLLAECDALCESSYTASSWTGFAAARESAAQVYQNETSTSVQIDAAYRSLKEAKKSLVAWEFRYSDVDYAEGNWQLAGINYVTRFDIMRGYEGTTLFGPDEEITRGQVALVLYRAAGADVAGEGDPQRAAETFSDVSADAYYAAAVDWCCQHGIATGYGDGKGGTTGVFGAEDSATREQLVKMVALFAQYMGADIEGASEDSLRSLNGWQTASDWSVPYFAWATENDIITGYDVDGQRWLFPKKSASRAQVAKIMMITMRDVLQLHR